MTQRASEIYARALELNPNHEDVLYYYGSTRLDLGDFAGAARAWRTLVSVNPSSSRAHAELGAVYLCLDRGAPFQLDSAERHFQRAHEINKEETGLLVRLGEVALLRGDLADAQRRFAAVLVTHAGNSLARFYSGYIAWTNGDATLAEREFRRAAATAGDTIRAAPAPGEGDTKHGTSALVSQTERCGELRAAAKGLHATDSTLEMTARYRKLKAVLLGARGRS